MGKSNLQACVPEANRRVEEPHVLKSTSRREDKNKDCLSAHLIDFAMLTMIFGTGSRYRERDSESLARGMRLHVEREKVMKRRGRAGEEIQELRSGAKMRKPKLQSRVYIRGSAKVIIRAYEFVAEDCSGNIRRSPGHSQYIFRFQQKSFAQYDCFECVVYESGYECIESSRASGAWSSCFGMTKDNECGLKSHNTKSGQIHAVMEPEGESKEKNSKGKEDPR